MVRSGTGGSSAGSGDSGPAGASVRAALAGGVAAVLLAALAPAAAGPYPYSVHSKREQAKKETVKSLQVPLIAISIADQRLTLYDKGVPVAHAPVSTGMAGHPTPTGVFSVLQKQVFHRSNIYSGAPMPFMQRITWSGVAIHAGVLPGYPASHGCIRMPAEFAVKLYHLTKPGTRVIVTRGEVVPVPFESARLFALPKLGNSVSELTTAGSVAMNEVETVKTAETRFSAVVSDAGEPAARALAGMSASKADDTGAAQPKPAASSVTAAPATATDGAGATGNGMVKPVTIVPAQPIDVKRAFEPRTTRPMSDVALAPAAPSELEPYGPERPLRPGPITVFISKKEGKVFVRKGFEQILDAPVTIAHPELALGTHVFTATAAKADGASFDWVAVSLPAGAAKRKAEAHIVRDRHGRPMQKVAAAAAPPAASAAEALERIDIPPEALARISSLMSPGATLIISDQGLGSETGLDTDFIVLTH